MQCVTRKSLVTMKKLFARLKVERAGNSFFSIQSCFLVQSRSRKEKKRQTSPNLSSASSRSFSEEEQIYIGDNEEVFDVEMTLFCRRQLPIWTRRRGEREQRWVVSRRLTHQVEQIVIERQDERELEGVTEAGR